MGVMEFPEDERIPIKQNDLPLPALEAAKASSAET